ncbi:MAG: UPF0262 family protein [Myxococcota bacterium]
MTIEVSIDTETWEQADPVRRREWQLSIDELGNADDLSFPESASFLDVTVSGATTTLVLRSEDQELGQVEIPRSALSDHITEYVDIVRQMDRAYEGAGSARLEALDMAKKLAHDDAAKALRKLCKPISADHATCRRLWTLLLTLQVDTTKLMGIRGHRPVR